MDYHVVAQGKTTIPGVDDAEELTLTDVRLPFSVALILLEMIHNTDRSHFSLYHAFPTVNEFYSHLNLLLFWRKVLCSE